MRTHDQMIACRDHILKALSAEMEHRDDHDDWIERERQAVATATDSWAVANGGWVLSAADVERIEGLAVGHSDYATKLALYVAERVTGRWR